MLGIRTNRGKGNARRQQSIVDAAHHWAGAVNLINKPVDRMGVSFVSITGKNQQRITCRGCFGTSSAFLRKCVRSKFTLDIADEPSN